MHMKYLWNKLAYASEKRNHMHSCRLYDTSRPPTPSKNVCLMKGCNTSSPSHHNTVCLLLSSVSDRPPIYLLHRPIPWEAEEPDSHRLLSQHALQLTAVVEVSDPCTGPWWLSGCQSPLTGALLHLSCISTQDTKQRLLPKIKIRVHSSCFVYENLKVINSLFTLTFSIAFGTLVRIAKCFLRNLQEISPTAVTENTAATHNMWIICIIYTPNNTVSFLVDSPQRYM